MRDLKTETVNADLEQRDTETILDKGLPIKLRTPLLLRLFMKNHFVLVLTNPAGAAYTQILTYYLSMELTSKDGYHTDFNSLLTVQAKHRKKVYRAFACGLLNSRLLRWLLTKPLAWMLDNSLPYKAACRVFELLVLHGGIDDFIQVIGLGARMNLVSKKEG
ncbi:hypothetical protein IDJ75_10625 [Mucilaginibacter rigui]|uniref:Uncharacterized protein n=1 Tax=Mucilaginibacter rigui TaxID=534635 RepID=A0ABR7X573_9SPHI|nr:hypothetical protein [Mucilaginibacter rigui]MBD1385733.1 hypothetical protein [Mucilaginibacter rigui]